MTGKCRSRSTTEPLAGKYVMQANKSRKPAGILGSLNPAPHPFSPVQRPDYRLSPEDRRRIAGNMVTTTLTRVE